MNRDVAKDVQQTPLATGLIGKTASSSVQKGIREIASRSPKPSLACYCPMSSLNPFGHGYMIWTLSGFRIEVLQIPLDDSKRIRSWSNLILFQ